MIDVIPMLTDVLVTVKAARDRGWQYRLNQTCDRLDLTLWWDPNALPEPAFDQGLEEAFAAWIYAKAGGSK